MCVYLKVTTVQIVLIREGAPPSSPIVMNI